MGEVTYIHGVIEKAQEMGLPQESILAAQSFAAFPESSWRDAMTIYLGNGERVRLKLDALPGGEEVLVASVGDGAWIWNKSDGELWWEEVKAHLRLTTCDAVAMTCLLGIALQRPVDVDGACACPVHRG